MRTSKLIIVTAFLMGAVVLFAAMSFAQISTVQFGSDDQWSIEPFTPGFSLLEAKSNIVYGSDFNAEGVAHFPSLPVQGTVTIPVFLVDWSDFDPQVDESNHANPDSTFPGYVQKTPQEISDFLNTPEGPAGYFNEISGGQLQITFQVFPWMVSDTSTYLKNKEPNYQFFSSTEQNWITDKEGLAKDVLRSAVVDLGVDFSLYDVDQNKVLDGFVIIYEGGPGRLAGVGLSWTNGAWAGGSTPTPFLNNIAALVDQTDPNFTLFTSQDILYKRFLYIPEQTKFVPGLSSVATWAHQIGHLLLGFKDYNCPLLSLGDYALSAKPGYPDFSDTAIPWDDINVLDGTGINWNGVTKMLETGINWGDIGTLDNSGVNWSDMGVSDITPHINWKELQIMTELGINWSAIDMSADVGTTPFHSSALEKWLYGGWIEPTIIEPGTYTLVNHHIKAGEIYEPLNNYLFKILIKGDPNHFITIENRYFLSPNQGGSIFNEELPGVAPESGLVIYEVNKNTTQPNQIRRFFPSRIQSEPVKSDKGAFQPGDEFHFGFGTNGFEINIIEITAPGETVSFTFKGENNPPVLNPIGDKTVDEGQLLSFMVSAVDPDGDSLTYGVGVGTLPPGADFDASTQIFSWTPGFDQAGIYTVLFIVVDGTSSDSEQILITVNDVDIIPPAAPTDLSAKFKKQQGTVLGAELLWTANTEPDLASYNVYRSTISGGPYTFIANSATNTYLDTSVTSGTFYYVVTALDQTGNESGQSNEASTKKGGGGGRPKR